MVRFFSRPAVPRPDDLCLVHSPPPGPPGFRPGIGGWWTTRASLPGDLDRTPGLFLGETGEGRALWSLEAPAPEHQPWTPLRQLMAEAPADVARTAVRAAELSAWRASRRFCGACGTPTRDRPGHLVLDCPGCGAEEWPRITPAVIMLVHRGPEVLLALHSRHAKPGATPLWTTLAGFVEAGETLEEAVAREVAEEVGITVGDPVYIGSQSWPFPHSLMAAFLVPWVCGDPTPDGEEIVDARWYRRDSLPEIPPPLTIARGLIRRHFAEPDL